MAFNPSSFLSKEQNYSPFQYDPSPFFTPTPSPQPVSQDSSENTSMFEQDSLFSGWEQGYASTHSPQNIQQFSHCETQEQFLEIFKDSLRTIPNDDSSPSSSLQGRVAPCSTDGSSRENTASLPLYSLFTPISQPMTNGSINSLAYFNSSSANHPHFISEPCTSLSTNPDNANNQPSAFSQRSNQNTLERAEVKSLKEQIIKPPHRLKDKLKKKSGLSAEEKLIRRKARNCESAQRSRDTRRRSEEMLYQNLYSFDEMMQEVENLAGQQREKDPLSALEAQFHHLTINKRNAASLDRAPLYERIKEIIETCLEEKEKWRQRAEVAENENESLKTTLRKILNL